MTEQLAPLPTSRATNAYELVDEVIATILEEPKRLDMGDWINRDTEWMNPAKRPACGTIGCFAGWVVLLKEGAEHTAGVDDRTFHWLIPGYTAWLQSDDEDMPDRMHDMRRALEAVFYMRGMTLYAPGTLQYATSVADRIRQFQTEYADDLRARTF